MLTEGQTGGIFVMCDWLVLFSLEHEFRKLFFMIRDLKVFNGL